MTANNQESNAAVQQQFDNISQQFNQMETARRNAVRQLQEMIFNIRQDTADQHLDDEARKRINNVLTRLHEMADVLETRPPVDPEPVSSTRDNTGLFLVGLIIGFIAGVILSRR